MKRTILSSLILIFLIACSSNQQPAKKVEYQDNSDIRKLEADQIKVGDKKIKAQAVLGTPTEESSTEAGTVMIWWFDPTQYQGDSYKTLKSKPEKIEGVKFIKLTISPKGIVTAKEFSL